MRLIVAFLFGLLAVSFAADTADDNDEVLEWDSNDGTGSTQSYNGIVIRVYQNDNGSPTITLGSEQDDHKDIYCLNFKGLFESQDYDDTVSEDATFTKIAGTEIDLADADCTTDESSDTQFTITCNNVDGATLTLTFTFSKDEQGDHGVEYVISLEDYTFTGDSHARLVMVQSLIECSEQYPYDDGNDSDNDNDNDEENDGMDTTESPDADTTDTNDNNDDDTTTGSPGNGRRRLLDDSSTDTDGADDNDTESVDDVDDDGNEIDSDSEDEEDGISSDDSNEYDSGTARFVMSGQAFDRCADPADDRMIESKLVYQSDSAELHIVFHHFDCDLSMDPFVGLDDSKYKNNDKTASMQITIAFIISLIIMSLL